MKQGTQPDADRLVVRRSGIAGIAGIAEIAEIARIAGIAATSGGHSGA